MLSQRSAVPLLPATAQMEGSGVGAIAEPEARSAPFFPHPHFQTVLLKPRAWWVLLHLEPTPQLRRGDRARPPEPPPAVPPPCLWSSRWLLPQAVAGGGRVPGVPHLSLHAILRFILTAPWTCVSLLFPSPVPLDGRPGFPLSRLLVGVERRGPSNLPKRRWRDWRLQSREKETSPGNVCWISLFLAQRGLPADERLRVLRVRGSCGPGPGVSRTCVGCGLLSANRRQSATSISR